ncbi:MAG: prepilin-type N-terminal cleavage/methylation domain-containing protein [Alphaproteobacteria bacterium]|nr:prepilin-type N-terminal cleavage/methylation domain-containing protein [Alphaproteobacteria bacterium]
MPNGRGILKFHNSLKGFTLVEMSVVLVIIGLLILAVVGASALLKGAKANRMIEDVQHFTDMAEDFEKIYGAPPGDITNFDTFFPGETNGNGDSSISATGNEDLLFWHHLQAASIFTAAKFDGTSRYEPGKGVPVAPFRNSGYKVRKDSTLGLYFEIAGFSTSPNAESNGVLTPDQAANIDQRVDDSDPNKGRVRGSGTGCVLSGKYNIANDNDVCILKILGRAQSKTETPGTLATCSSPTGVEGEVQVDSTTGNQCPDGYEGKVLRVCQANGSWEIEKRCEIIRCYGGNTYQETRNLTCPSAYTGTYKEICTQGAVWETQNPSTFPCSAKAGDSCSSARSLPCPIGYTGSISQTCTNGVYDTPVTSSCVPITCSESGTPRNIGYISTTVKTCSGSFTSGEYTSVCTIDQRSGKQWKAITNTCQASSPCSTPGATQTLSCPDGEAGAMLQTCPSSGANWVTTSNTCIAKKCGGETIGSYRLVEGDVSSGGECPSGHSGTVLEICQEDGTWARDYSNCTP